MAIRAARAWRPAPVRTSPSPTRLVTTKMVRSRATTSFVERRLREPDRPPRFVQFQDPAQLTLTTPPVSVQEQKFPAPMPTGTQPSAELDDGGQRHAQDVGVDAQAAGVGWQDRPDGPAVPGV